MKNKRIESNLPKEEKRLILLLDALGFKNLYTNERTKAVNFICWLRKNNKEFNCNIRQLTPSTCTMEFSPDLYTSSDYLIFSLPIIEDFSNLLWTVSRTIEYVTEIYVQSLIFGIPLRGCISFGEMIFALKEDIIFGAPLFEAMEHEKSNILYPRIVVLPSTYELLTTTNVHGGGYYPKWQDFISDYNYVDVDGYVCVDWINKYLITSRNVFDINGEKYIGVSDEAIINLIKIREQVVYFMEKFNSEKRIREYQKWCYLCTYFNNTLENYFKRFKERGFSIDPIGIKPFGHFETIR